MATVQNTPVFPTSKTCPQCGTEFKCKPSHFSRRVYCCKPCYNAATPGRIRGENNPKWRGGGRPSACGECGAPVTIGHHEKDREVKFCSRRCVARHFGRKVAKPESPRSRHNHERLAKVVQKKAIRQCPTCSMAGVPKGRKYHPDCRPVHGHWVDATCGVCGKVRRAHVSPNKPAPRTCRGCLSVARKGEGNNNWKGGITPINQKIRASEEYKQWRTAVFQRDGYKCVWCGQLGHKLHADHIKPFATYPELRFDVSNGRTLCKSCHEETDTYLSKGKKIKDAAAYS